MKGTTTNLADFGSLQRRKAEELLKAWRLQGLPEDFDNDEVTIRMNTNSGYVFLTNSDYQVAMLHGGILESFYSCPICGHEGFLEEMNHGDSDSECQSYYKEIMEAAR